MYSSLNRNARPNNNQLITYYERVIYFQKYIKYSVDSTYNILKLSMHDRLTVASGMGWLLKYCNSGKPKSSKV